ncbi:hypothetical protein [Streptomyces sp. SCL15-6]|uniref:hypothetical protein n=1 Tax=Streptomyces sp. SCL15-6 TaxID=2967222 RepID=UPI00296765EB|nr:hypothetical protein [Streptomyces sp. SCL15-6]
MIVLLLVLVAVSTAVVLGRGAGTRLRRPYPAQGPPGVRAPRRPGAPFRVVAQVAGGAAALLYVWGALCVLSAVMEAEDGGTGSAPMRPCRTGASPELSGRVVGYSVSYLPLRFRCETGDGAGYASADIPGYVNPGLAGLALTAVASAVAAGWATELRARAERRPVTGHSNGPGGPV